MEKRTGRPRTPEYTKLRFRYAKISREFGAALEEMESEKDKEVIRKVLERLRGVKC